MLERFWAVLGGGRGGEDLMMGNWVSKMLCF